MSMHTWWGADLDLFRCQICPAFLISYMWKLASILNLAKDIPEHLLPLSNLQHCFFPPNFALTFKNGDRLPSPTQQIEHVHLYFTLSTNSSFLRMVSWNNVAIISAQGTLKAVALLLACYLGFRMAKVVMWGSWPSQCSRQEAKAVFFLVLPLSFLPGTRSLSSSHTDTERLLEN